MSQIKFRMAAMTDMGRVRTNNEDNFQVSADLDITPMRWTNNQTVDLGQRGALLAVADGMGGTNAGEVASEIAMETLREMFTPERITDEVVKTRYTIERFMKEVVVEADKRIKSHAASHPESKGMGTTMVMAWLIDGKVYVCWCGDSRAYVFNPATGLKQISKDHSYVQELVDAGKLDAEDAFDFPESNIITRCLCDGGPAAKPDVLLMPHELCDGDVIMLCSDGLSGMIRDHDTQAIMARDVDDLDLMVRDLIKGALDGGGADNVTIALAQIISGGKNATASPAQPARKRKVSDTLDPDNPKDPAADTTKVKRIWMWIAIGACALLGALIVYLLIGRGKTTSPASDGQPCDSTEIINNEPSDGTRLGDEINGALENASDHSESAQPAVSKPGNVTNPPQRRTAAPTADPDSADRPSKATPASDKPTQPNGLTPIKPKSNPASDKPSEESKPEASEGTPGLTPIPANGK